MPEIKKGNDSANNVSRVTSFNVCKMAGHIYIVPSFLKLSQIYQSYRADTISILKITKGNNSAKNVGAATVVNLCILSGHALYLCQVS